MTEGRKTVRVVAAIIMQGDKILATQRGYGEYKDGWEFPGGKIERGERPEAALVREIREELAVDINVGILLTTVEYDYPEFHLSMDCFRCTLKENNDIRLLEHEAARWLSKDELMNVDWLPADINVVKLLRNELYIELEDNEWPLVYTDHDRLIARAIVTDGKGNFYFVRAERDDDFGRATLIETSGGGVEPGEDLNIAIRRELKEELGAEVEIITRIGVVSDYYNLIHRHNINNYYLCKVVDFGDKHLTEDEINDFHLSTLKMTFDEAVNEYERCSCTPIGRLVAAREVPVLRRAKEILDNM